MLTSPIVGCVFRSNFGPVYTWWMHCFSISIELSLKSFKEGRNQGVNPSSRNLYFKSLLDRHVLAKSILKVG